MSNISGMGVQILFSPLISGLAISDTSIFEKISLPFKKWWKSETIVTDLEKPLGQEKSRVQVINPTLLSFPDPIY